MKSPINYVGGKSKLAKTIINKLPQHITYCEAYAGAAWVFFCKEPSKVEVINDLDSELVSFYRVVQNHLEEFLRQFKYLLTSREMFNDFKAQRQAGGLTDIQQAARYYYNKRQAFGGKVIGQTFGVDRGRGPRINLLRLEEELSAVHLRLAQVIVEHLPVLDLIKRYDSVDTAFYLDPPYHSEPCYKHNMAMPDYEALAAQLATIAGKFVLSINDHPAMREVFGSFNITPVRLKYTIGKDNATEAKELIITNF